MAQVNNVTSLLQLTSWNVENLCSLYSPQTAIKKNNPKKYLRSVGDGETVEFDVVSGAKVGNVRKMYKRHSKRWIEYINHIDWPVT